MGQKPHVDVAICGAGPVGLCLAILLVKRGMSPARIALIDAKTLDDTTRDPRSIALSYGSVLCLQRCGVWPFSRNVFPLTAPPTAIHQIHVSRRGHWGRTLIDREDHELPALGYVSRYGDVVAHLAASPMLADVRCLRPAKMSSHHETEDAVTLSLEKEALMARIMVQAEGGGSEPVRDYAQWATVAHVTTTRPIPHRAFERFTAEGPLALLPQDSGAQGHHYALVWCARPDTARTLLSLDDTAFLQALEASFGQRVGRFIAVSKRHVFPLTLQVRTSSSAQRASRCVAIGNAAQTLHPVAGQGLNLGFRDAMSLAKCVVSRGSFNLSPTALAHFAQHRQRDRKTTVGLTDAMARLFASAPDGSMSQALLGSALGALDIASPAKQWLARRMMFGHP